MLLLSVVSSGSRGVNKLGRRRETRLVNISRREKLSFPKHLPQHTGPTLLHGLSIRCAAKNHIENYLRIFLSPLSARTESFYENEIRGNVIRTVFFIWVNIITEESFFPNIGSGSQVLSTVAVIFH